MSTQRFKEAMSNFMNPSCEESRRCLLLKTLMVETHDATDRDEAIRAATTMMDIPESECDEIRDQLLSEPDWKSAVLSFRPDDGEFDELCSWFYCLQQFEKEQLMKRKKRLFYRLTPKNPIGLAFD